MAMEPDILKKEPAIFNQKAQNSVSDGKKTERNVIMHLFDWPNGYGGIYSEMSIISERKSEDVNTTCNGYNKDGE